MTYRAGRNASLDAPNSEFAPEKSSLTQPLAPMPLTSSGPDDIVGFLVEGGLTPSANSEQIAAALAIAGERISMTLGQIIGRRGVSALLQRSVHLTLQKFPWLLSGQPLPVAEVDFERLRLTVAQRSPSEAAACCWQLMHDFEGLLHLLIGPSLSAQMLENGWSGAGTGNNAQDTPP